MLDERSITYREFGSLLSRLSPRSLVATGSFMAAGFAIVEPSADAAMALLGYGESSDAWHMSAPEPDGRGAFESMTAALQRAAQLRGVAAQAHLGHGLRAGRCDARQVEPEDGRQVKVLQHVQHGRAQLRLVALQEARLLREGRRGAHLELRRRNQIGRAHV